MTKPKIIPVVQPTEKQREWLNKEKKRTGNSESSIIRGLIQDEIENEITATISKG